MAAYECKDCGSGSSTGRGICDVCGAVDHFGTIALRPAPPVTPIPPALTGPVAPAGPLPPAPPVHKPKAGRRPPAPLPWSLIARLVATILVAAIVVFALFFASARLQDEGGHETPPVPTATAAVEEVVAPPADDQLRELAVAYWRQKELRECFTPTLAFARSGPRSGTLEFTCSEGRGDVLALGHDGLGWMAPALLNSEVGGVLGMAYRVARERIHGSSASSELLLLNYVAERGADDPAWLIEVTTEASRRALLMRCALGVCSAEETTPPQWCCTLEPGREISPDLRLPSREEAVQLVRSMAPPLARWGTGDLQAIARVSGMTTLMLSGSRDSLRFIPLVIRDGMWRATQSPTRAEIEATWSALVRAEAEEAERQASVVEEPLPVEPERIVTPPEPPPTMEVAPVQMVTRAVPRYTEAARRTRLRAEVILDVLVGTRGEVLDIVVVKEAPLGLVNEAEKAVRRSTFAPGQTSAGPASGWIRVTYSFEP